MPVQDSSWRREGAKKGHKLSMIWQLLCGSPSNHYHSSIILSCGQWVNCVEIPIDFDLFVYWFGFVAGDKHVEKLYSKKSVSECEKNGKWWEWKYERISEKRK